MAMSDRNNSGPRTEGYEQTNGELASEMDVFDACSPEVRAAIAAAPRKLSALGTINKYSTDYSRLIAIQAYCENVCNAQGVSPIFFPGKRG